MTRYDVAKQHVLSGNSKVFDEWQKRGNISAEEFLEAVEWVCEDPLDDHGYMTREIGLEPTLDAMTKYFIETGGGLEKFAAKSQWNPDNLKGRIVKLERVNGYEREYGRNARPGLVYKFIGFYDTEKGRTWSCCNYHMCLNSRDKI